MRLLGCILVVFFCLLSCRDKVAPITTGHYGNNLDICTESYGHFFAYFYPDTTDKSTYWTITGMPYQPVGNMIIWEKNARDTVAYGEVSWQPTTQMLRLGFVDSVVFGYRQRDMEANFSLTKAVPDWKKFYDFDSEDSCFIYTAPTYTAPKIRVPYHSPLYGVEVRTDWVAISTDSGQYWLPFLAVRL